MIHGWKDLGSLRIWVGFKYLLGTFKKVRSPDPLSLLDRMSGTPPHFFVFANSALTVHFRLAPIYPYLRILLPTRTEDTEPYIARLEYRGVATVLC